MNMLPVALSATPTLIHFELGAIYFSGRKPQVGDSVYGEKTE